jgi:polyferredoxin
MDRIGKAFRMDDEAWRRHANPWSVWTRFAAIPPLILSIWSRTWIGWWCLVPLAVVVVWLFVNPSAFAPVEHPTSWTARGIYGERAWLRERGSLPREHRQVLRLLVVLGSAGIALLVWGLVVLDPWPTVFGATLVVIGQLWRIDRFARLYDDLTGL